MGSNIDEFKEVKWSINYLTSKLDSANDRKDDSDDGKYTDSSEKEGDHGNRQRSNKDNTALNKKGGITKDKRIKHNSEWPTVVFNMVWSR